MAAAKFDVNRVFVVDDASHAGHGSIDQFLLLDQGSLLQFIR